ncbi:MAG TPA: type II glyceraldehyde-3-phosphate dehydrogenase [Candidatus Korarchaeota archaeon]|nr:type II glyceraldehyde-3-phosphate dehydrogenase [Candidatus Korarchaeota archaeon]
MIRVGVVGYGTIGKRIASAILKQPDMILVGVVKRAPDYSVKIGISRGLHFFIPDETFANSWNEAGVKFHGTITQLLEECDVVVDATPKGTGMKNKGLYENNGLKAVFQGGEPPEVGDLSFVAQVNYDKALGVRFLRVVSCNTTGLARLLHAINQEHPIDKAIACIVRRSVDPNQDAKGIIDCVVPTIGVSHHTKDLKTVLSDVNIITFAVKIPVTHFHVHMLSIKLRNEVSSREIIDILEEARRIALIPSKDGLRSTAKLLDLSRELERSRFDFYENLIWLDSVCADGKWIHLMQAIHQEAIVVPENIDAIRAISGLADALKSMDLTDSALSITRARFF